MAGNLVHTNGLKFRTILLYYEELTQPKLFIQISQTNLSRMTPAAYTQIKNVLSSQLMIYTFSTIEF